MILETTGCLSGVRMGLLAIHMHGAYDLRIKHRLRKERERERAREREMESK